jgi:RND family efflux transporter MFP subunit
MTTHSNPGGHLLPAHATDMPRLPAPGEVPLLPEYAGESGGEKGAKRNGSKKSSKLIVIVGIALVAVAALVVLLLVLLHHHRVTKTRDARSQELAKGPKLSVVKVSLSEPRREIVLPGEVRGFNQATLYGKVSGYVSEIRVDRGDHVKAGDILAVIESPETRDDVLSAQSNREYTQRTAQRLKGLSTYGVVSMLDRDNAVNAEKRADADLQRARNVFDYTLVRAPFDGVVTARYVDLGALVPAATSATQQAQPVVDIADVDRVRVFVYLGQDAAPFVKTGDTVTLLEDERPAQRVPATITRVAGALDPRTRTMQCEVDIDNRQWHLIPGTFVHVRVEVSVTPSPTVPDDALVTRDGTPHVAIVEGGRVHYRPVEVGNDDGATTRILSGLSGGETIGMNVPVEIDEDEIVQPAPQSANAKSAGSEQTTSAAGSPTSTPTSEARPLPPPAHGPPKDALEPNTTSSNGADAGAGAH